MEISFKMVLSKIQIQYHERPGLTHVILKTSVYCFCIVGVVLTAWTITYPDHVALDRGGRHLKDLAPVQCV